MRMEKHYPVYSFYVTEKSRKPYTYNVEKDEWYNTLGKPLTSSIKGLTPYKKFFRERNRPKLKNEFYDSIVSMPIFAHIENWTDKTFDWLDGVYRLIGKYGCTKEALLKYLSTYAYNSDIGLPTQRAIVYNVYYKGKGLAENDFYGLINDLHYSLAKLASLSEYKLKLALRILKDEAALTYFRDGGVGVVDDISRALEVLGKKKFPSGNFIKNYAFLMQEYCQFTNKDKVDDSLFTNSQLSIPLAFENDVFFLTVPKVYYECAVEGKIMSNCVGGYEWNNYLAQGKRKIVFMRRKDNPSIPYIDIDIKVVKNNDGCYYTTAQCLKRFNREIGNNETLVINFIKQYRNYLRAIPVTEKDKEIYGEYCNSWGW